MDVDKVAARCHQLELRVESLSQEVTRLTEANLRALKILEKVSKQQSESADLIMTNANHIVNLMSQGDQK